MAAAARRRGVGVAAVVAIAAACGWWMGRLWPPRAAPAPAPAAALASLDEALLRRDAEQARALLAAAEGAAPPERLALRRAALAALPVPAPDGTPPPPDPLAGRLVTRCCPVASPLHVHVDPATPRRLLGLSWDLLASDDGGRSWSVHERLREGWRTASAQQRRLTATADGTVLVWCPAQRDDRGALRAGRIRRGGVWSDVPFPDPPLRGRRWDLAEGVLGGDGVVLAAFPDADGDQRHRLARWDGAMWTAGIEVDRLHGLAPTRTGALAAVTPRGAAVKRGEWTSWPLVMCRGADGLLPAPLTGQWPQGLPPLSDGDLVLPQYAGVVTLVAADGTLADRFTVRPPWVFKDNLAVVVHAREARRWYTVHPDRGLMRSDDGGRTWRLGRGELARLRGRPWAGDGIDADLYLVTGSHRDDTCLRAFRDDPDPATCFAEPRDD